MTVYVGTWSFPHQLYSGVDLLVSPTSVYYLALQSNGQLVVSRGSDPGTHSDPVWHGPTTSVTGPFVANPASTAPDINVFGNPAFAYRLTNLNSPVNPATIKLSDSG